MTRASSRWRFNALLALEVNPELPDERRAVVGLSVVDEQARRAGRVLLVVGEIGHEGSRRPPPGRAASAATISWRRRSSRDVRDVEQRQQLGPRCLVVEQQRARGRARASSSAHAARGAVRARRRVATGLRSAAWSFCASIQSCVGSTPSLRAASRESAAASCASGTFASISATRANALARRAAGRARPVGIRDDAVERVGRAGCAPGRCARRTRRRPRRGGTCRDRGRPAAARPSRGTRPAPSNAPERFTAHAAPPVVGSSSCSARSAAFCPAASRVEERDDLVAVAVQEAELRRR